MERAVEAGWRLALTTYRRSAAERGAGEGGGGRTLKFAIENEDQDCKQFALYRNDFSNAFGVDCQRFWRAYLWGHFVVISQSGFS
jgi:hypothetical protein